MLRPVGGFVEEKEEEINDEIDEYLSLTEESYLCAMAELVGSADQHPIMPRVDASKVLVLVIWGEESPLEIWSIYDPGTLYTLANDPIWNRLEGGEIKVDISLTGIGGKVSKVTHMKKVICRTLHHKAELEVYRCSLGEGRILLNAEDGRRLGIVIAGVPVSFSSRAEGKSVQDRNEWFSGITPSQEVRRPIEEVKLIERGIEEALRENQRLLENMACTLPGSEFVVHLNETTPTYTQQYLILEALKAKMNGSERVG